jgi:DNA-binding beta-propeller fold protein YncE
MHAEARALALAISASAVVGAVGLAGCGREERPQPPRAGVTTVDATPHETVPQPTWSRGRVKVAYPDGLAAVGDAVFVKTDDGHVVRIDRASRRVVADVEVDTAANADHYCQGIGSDGHTLWACSAADHDTTDLVRLDPVSLKVLATVPVDKVFDQLTVPVVDGRVWVLAGSGDTLTEVDTTTNHTTSSRLGRRCLQAAVTAGTVYLTCQLTDEVIAVDAGTGRISHEVDVRGPVNVVADDHDVWVSGTDGLVRLSPDLDRRSVYPGLVAGRDGDLLLTTDALWVRTGPGFLARIDRPTGDVAARYAIDPIPSGGSLLAAADEIWTSSYDDDVVLVVAAAVGKPR